MRDLHRSVPAFDDQSDAEHVARDYREEEEVHQAEPPLQDVDRLLGDVLHAVRRRKLLLLGVGPAFESVGASPGMCNFSLRF